MTGENDMPVKVQKRGDVYRVIEADSGRIAKTMNGNPRDGGGHGDRDKAMRQARAMNMAIAKKS